MMQRSHSLHVRGGEGDQGVASPASPAAGGAMWVPNSAAPVQRSISVVVQDHHSISASNIEDLEGKNEHDNRKAMRLKAEQTVHLIPLILLLCALFLWLGSSSSSSDPFNIEAGANMLSSHGNFESSLATHQQSDNIILKDVPKEGEHFPSKYNS